MSAKLGLSSTSRCWRRRSRRSKVMAMGRGASSGRRKSRSGMTSLIPDAYVSDLQVRLGLYRRLSDLATREDIDQFGAELEDRFGALPPEVETLLSIIEIKGYCVTAGIGQIDAGPKGGVIQFRDNTFANPQGLVEFMQRSRGGARLQADHKLVYKADWEKDGDRIKGVLKVVRALAALATEAAPAAA